MEKIITFDTAKSLYSYLNKHHVLNKLDLFNNTRPYDLYDEDPHSNAGYVMLVDNNIAGVAILEDEYGDGSIYLNHLFEFLPEFRGKGLAQKLYQYIKDDLQMDYIHGFVANESLKQYWTKMGQHCISDINNEMLEAVSEDASIDDYINSIIEDNYKYMYKNN